jgi:hypothetical protein
VRIWIAALRHLNGAIEMVRVVFVVEVAAVG